MVDRPAQPRPQHRKPEAQMEADRTKEREFYRYYHHSQQPRSDADRHLPVLSSLQLPTPATAPLPVKPSNDKALTAFAQLGAFRLNTHRCLISFFDRRNIYVLAEATRTASLITGEPEFEQDALQWGTSIFPKHQSICYHTVRLPWELPLDSEFDYQHHPSLVVNDLTQDERFKNYPFVSGPPHIRFYAGVPIRSPSGHSIGTYCVLDDKPRNGVSDYEMRFLKDMAGTIMRHLEMSRATEDHKRSGIMVKSLGSFADGKSSLDDWWEENDVASSTVSPSDAPMAPRQRRPTIHDVSPTALTKPFPLPRNNSAESSVPSLNSVHPISPSSVAPGSTIATPASEILDPVKAEVAYKSSSSAGEGKPDTVAPETRAIFERAAQMIVEAVEAEGAVFFDAKVSTFGGLVDDDFTSDQPPEPDKPCVILGAARFTSSQNLHSPSTQIHMSESVLRHLLRSYAHGQIFNLDDETTAMAQNDSGSADEIDLMASRRSDSIISAEDEQVLREVFPRARSLIVYPLWDAHRDRWFSSLMIWSSDPMRVFTHEQELSYLSAFSNSVMAEVARLDTRLADSAKADFISSISHELRSPLHGILGMADLLKDTVIDTQQQSHIQTIENCGKTLLETINHVLDYAKINNLTRGNTKKRTSRRAKSVKHVITPTQGHTNDIMTITTDTDISVLVEEVLETVFAGFNFSKNNFESLDQRPKKFEPPPISVIVDVNKWDNYVFRTQPGAWRRVLMNLFGNALKYTPAGFIKIKLQVVPSADKSDDCVELKLTVTDSGIGMSEDYINNRLFHSFAQENPLSQGTGLGLSIVKQLVELLGGDVEVRSEKGRGTKFTVNCPLRPGIFSPAMSALQPGQDVSNAYKRTHGKTVQFVGFDDDDEYFPVKSLKNKTGSKIATKALEGLCKDWFGMEVWDAKTSHTTAPDLVMATETGARELRAKYSQSPEGVPSAPVVVLCRAAALVQSTTAITVPGLIFECIAQPCGPHKLAKALVSCLDRQANRLIAHSTNNDNDNSSIPGLAQLSLKENAPPLSLIQSLSSSTLSLPRPHVKTAISAPEIRSVNHTPVNATHAPPRSLNCLAVDDNPINLRLLRTFVEKLGHRHVLAKHGLEALDAYKNACQDSSPLAARIDVILMDINMPEMDGMEATRQIRAYERDNELPPVTIIALTGVASSEAQQEAHASGVNLFLIKPVRLGDLEVVLKGVVTSEEAEKKMERLEKDEASAEQYSTLTDDGGKESQRSSSETHKKTKSLI